MPPPAAGHRSLGRISCNVSLAAAVGFAKGRTIQNSEVLLVEEHREKFSAVSVLQASLMRRHEVSHRQRRTLARTVPRFQFTSEGERAASHDLPQDNGMGESGGISRRRSEWSLRGEGVTKRRVGCYELLHPLGENASGTSSAHEERGAGLGGLEKGMHGLRIRKRAVDRERLVVAFRLLRKRLREIGADVTEVRVVADGGREEGGDGDEGGGAAAPRNAPVEERVEVDEDSEDSD